MLSNQLHPPYYNDAYKSRSLYSDTNGNHMMRGLSHGGGHHQNGGLHQQNGSLSDRKPSKLEQMRADYQRKLMKEKEERMVQMYEDNQKKAMMRMTRNGSGGPHNGALSPSGGKSVRDFFNERRKMEANGMTVPPIDNHYRQAKGYSSPGEWSSRGGSGTSVNMRKYSAGRDRSQPLAPIRRPVDTHEVANNNGNVRSGIPQRQHNQPTNGHEENPFQGRPRLVKHKPLPPTNGNHTDDNNNDGKFQAKPPAQPSQLPKYVPQNRRPGQQSQMQSAQQQQQYQRQQPPQEHSYKQPQPPQYQRQQPGRSPAKTRHGVHAAQQPEAEGKEKLTDFKKWQMDQNRARENRLKKINSQRNIEQFDDDGVWAKPEDDPRFPVDSVEDDDENDEEGEEEQNNSVANTGRTVDSEIQRKERELMEKIAQQQNELERMKRDREREEEEERLEMERQKKREAIERQRQKKIDEERRKEEERQRKLEEEEERMERQREEKFRKEEDKRRKEDEKRRKEEEKRRREEEKLMMKRQKEEEKRMVKQNLQMSSRSQNYNNSPDHYNEDSPVPTPRRTATIPSWRDPISSRSQMKQDDIDERPIAQSDSNYYAKAAASSDAKGSTGSLARCKVCGRSFATDRLAKHQAACSKANKPRKEFDASKKRVEGTELAKYAGKAKKAEPPKKKSNWRAKHEEFIQSLRYAKKITEIEKQGGDLRNLPPPPPSQNPDFVQCPHCARTFNETAAERHIPRCQQLKTRPPPMNTRRR